MCLKKVWRVFHEYFNEVLLSNYVVAWISSQLPKQKEDLVINELKILQNKKKSFQKQTFFWLGGRPSLAFVEVRLQTLSEKLCGGVSYFMAYGSFFLFFSIFCGRGVQRWKISYFNPSVFFMIIKPNIFHTKQTPCLPIIRSDTVLVFNMSHVS